MILKDLKLRITRRLNKNIAEVFGFALGTIFVVEYPKCGASWVSNILSIYFNVPRASDNSKIKLGRRNVFQSHTLFRKSYISPIVVVRDPRDVFVSYYNYQYYYRNRNLSADILKVFQLSPNKSQRDNFYNYLKIKLNRKIDIDFHYREFVESWINNGKNVLIVKYEDMLQNPSFVLKKILKHLGKKSLDEKLVKRAVGDNAFESVTRRAPGEEDKSAFVRKGIEGDWLNYFNQNSCRLIWEKEGWTMKQLSYESDDSWIEKFIGSL